MERLKSFPMQQVRMSFQSFVSHTNAFIFSKVKKILNENWKLFG